MSQRIKNAKRRHAVRLMAVMLVYLAMVFAAARLEDLVTSKLILTLLALAPAAPMGLACYVYLRGHQQMDEREQSINANAAGLALMISVIAATIAGFLQSFGVVVIEDAMLWFASFLILVWGGVRLFMGGDC